MPQSRLWSHLQGHGRELDQTFSNSMDMTTLSSLTTTPTYRSYVRYHMDNATQQRSSHSQKKSSQNMEYPKCSSDNGPQYSSSSFAEFADDWKFTHLTSSPHCPEGNGFAKSMVKVVKQLLQRAKYSGSDPQLALLSYRSTLLDSKIASPAELLY